MKIKKVLIANRGEIALRIARSLMEMDIEPVIAYAYEDKDSLPVKLIEKKVCIGKGNVRDSYLNIPNIMSAATLLKVDAIHPGYGLLSENPMFAKIVEDHGIKFIGPKSETMKSLKDKAHIRKIAKENGIPILEGTVEPVQNLEDARKIARSIGYPVMIKAARGGGGKGIRIARDEGELSRIFEIAKSEAKNSFGSDAIYIEKYLKKARHIEVQVIGDTFGNIQALGTRECSMQRNHQKLIEEADAVILSEEEKKNIENNAIKFAKAINYSNVGTVEFLYSDGKHYLLEMNARIQVEHPVTEEVFNVDIVKEQIKIAEGEKIRFDVKQALGHAIEFRINAEDPFENFKPSFGKIEKLRFPLGRGVRIDSHIYEGYVVPTLFDSLLAKVIVKGKNRNDALDIARRVLNEIVIEGIKTNIPFHRKMLQNENFLKNNIHTGFVEEFIKNI
ncbi:acetyl-CoA carboxylase biotin carboxylase subunit [Caldisericum exile]|uniref:biotin carboxylase n=1 Tax=Caldisericum exile (strain DSM 21853 / NBRC 104410 / AZM16c01) TaxID=511051 RepID=A0A7U6GFU2_CALEA|nr:biotin carboxylase N-terminal domain-containing protein [Caldisericum exile]BAL81623.1 acetyl-CoA carboxylase biotin carboxylase [Caldisericum exile AZM16c01]